MKISIAIIGGGPSAMALGCFIDTDQYDVTIYEKNKAIGRKFLVAGKGGFNLTHGEPIQDIMKRYTPPAFVRSALEAFTNEDFRVWLDEIGIPTYVGSSNRVFPTKGIKPIEVLESIRDRLAQNQVRIEYEHEWTGWTNDEELLFNVEINRQFDIVVFAMGGASWRVTGSDGSWMDAFKEIGIVCGPFQSSNCEYIVKWNKDFINKYEGSPLKNISISCGGITNRGELVITRSGLEGNAIYALSPQIRSELKRGKAKVSLDLKPMLSGHEVLEKLENNSTENTTSILLKNLKFSKAQVGLLKSLTTKEIFVSKKRLASHIKKLEIDIVGTGSIDEAISTVGGISLESVDEYFQLKKLPRHYCLGEMLDWDAPTGGYLLQACFSMGVYLASILNKRTSG